LPERIQVNLTEAKISVLVPREWHGNGGCVRLVIPFIVNQLDALERNLKWWQRKDIPPCEYQEAACIDIHFLVDVIGSKLNESLSSSNQANMNYMGKFLESRLRSMVLAIPNLEGCVGQISFTLFSGGDQSYLAGSYRTLKHLLFESANLGYQAMALYETDAYPIMPGWMNKLYLKAFFEEEFLIKGTVFHTGLHMEYFFDGHINGNCLWFVKEMDMISTSFGLIDAVNKALNHSIAYDVLINLLFVKEDDSGEGCLNSFMQKECKYAVNFVEDKHLKTLWRKFYVDSYHISNDIPEKRPLCKYLSGMRRITLHEKFSNHLFVHCRHHSARMISRLSKKERIMGKIRKHSKKHKKERQMPKVNETKTKIE